MCACCIILHHNRAISDSHGEAPLLFSESYQSSSSVIPGRLLILNSSQVVLISAIFQWPVSESQCAVPAVSLYFHNAYRNTNMRFNMQIFIIFCRSRKRYVDTLNAAADKVAPNDTSFYSRTLSEMIMGLGRGRIPSDIEDFVRNTGEPFPCKLQTSNPQVEVRGLCPETGGALHSEACSAVANLTLA